MKAKQIFLAFLLSFLTVLGFSVLFGLIHSLGRYNLVFPTIQIFAGSLVYLALVKKINIKHVVISLLWTAILTFGLDFFATIICEAVIIINKTTLNFTQAISKIFELWKTNAEANDYLNKIIAFIAGMTALGVAISAFRLGLIIKEQKKQNHQPIQSTEESNSTKNNNELEKVEKINYKKSFIEIYQSYKSTIKNYLKDKDDATLKTKLAELKNQYAKEIKDEEFKNFAKSTLEKLKNQDLNSLDKFTVNAIKMIIK